RLTLDGVGLAARLAARSLDLGRHRVSPCEFGVDGPLVRAVPARGLLAPAGWGEAGGVAATDESKRFLTSRHSYSRGASGAVLWIAGGCAGGPCAPTGGEPIRTGVPVRSARTLVHPHQLHLSEDVSAQGLGELVAREPGLE